MVSGIWFGFLVLWIEPRAPSMSSMCFTTYDRNLRLADGCHMEIWWVRISDQSNLTTAILLCKPLKGWDYRHIPPCLGSTNKILLIATQYRKGLSCDSTSNLLLETLRIEDGGWSNDSAVWFWLYSCLACSALIECSSYTLKKFLLFVFSQNKINKKTGLERWLRG